MGRLRSFTLLPHSVPARITGPIVGVLARTGATPNHLSLLGFAGNVGAAALAARGQFLAAGLMMLGFSAIDVLDGALARATGRATRFGAVLDSALDRLSEAAVLGGLAFYFASRGDREEVVLCFAAIAGSWLVSYVRAQAKNYGLDLREGLFTRAERVILLSAVLIIDQVRIGLWILAIMALATGLQRLYVAWRHFGSQPATDAATSDEEQEP
ncbi:MAG: CDP-alcohol phosphatidyltransferase family protein [Dehalococcoidia bacterium]